MPWIIESRTVGRWTSLDECICYYDKESAERALEDRRTYSQNTQFRLSETDLKKMQLQREGTLFVIESREVGPWQISSDTIYMNDEKMAEFIRIANEIQAKYGGPSKPRENRARFMQVIP